MENKMQEVSQLLSDEKVDALLVSSVYNIRYLTGFDGFQTEDREGYLLVTKSKMFLFASALTAEAARQKVKNAEIVELSAEHRLLQALQEIIDKHQIKTLGFEKNLTYSEFTHFKKLKNVKLRLTDELIEEIRITKSLNELQSIEKACKLTDNTYSHILKNIRIDQSEKDVAWEIEKYIREHGGELAFPTIVAFEENSAIPHHKTGDTKLSKNSIVLLDFGAKVDGFCADMSRTFYVGHAPKQFKKLYEAVQVAQEKGFTPSTFTCSEVDKIGRDYIVENGFPSIPHSVGHGIGLEVHELPHITPGADEEILPNTVFTIEPGIYQNGVGGVRIEDTVFFNGKEIISLTKSPKNLIELD